MKKAMQNCCSVILTAALALVGVSASAGEKLTLSVEEFMQIGQNLTYLDGLPIVEEERAAVVWINPGSTFAGLNYDGTEVDPENNMIVAVGTIMNFAEVSAEGQLAGLACELPEGIRASDCDWVLLDTRGLVMNSYNQNLEKSYDTDGYMMSDQVIVALKGCPEMLFKLLNGGEYEPGSVTADMIAFALGLPPDRLSDYLDRDFLVAASRALHGTKWIQASGIRPLNITGPLNSDDASSPNVVYGWYLVSAPMPYVDLNMPAMKDPSLITAVMRDYFGGFPQKGYLETAYDFSAFNAVGRNAVLQMKEMGADMHCSIDEAMEAFNSWPSEIRQAVGQPILDGFDYLRWHADFVVTFDRDVKANSIALAGQFNNDWTGNDWLAFPTPNDIKANEGLRLLGGGAGFTIAYNYNMIMFDVGRFRCGAANTSKDNIGTTMRVELRLYRPSISMDEILNYPLKVCSNGEDETGEYITVGEYSYTFQTVDVAGDPDERPLIANVNGQNYLSLQEAINAAANGDLVTVLRAPSETNVFVSAGKSIKLDAGVNLALCSVEGDGKWTMSGFPYMGVEDDADSAAEDGVDMEWNLSASNDSVEMAAILKFIASEGDLSSFTQDEQERFNSAYLAFMQFAEAGATVELVAKADGDIACWDAFYVVNRNLGDCLPFGEYDEESWEGPGVKAGEEFKIWSDIPFAEFVLALPKWSIGVCNSAYNNPLVNSGKTISFEVRVVCGGQKMTIGKFAHKFVVPLPVQIQPDPEADEQEFVVSPSADLVKSVMDELGDDVDVKVLEAALEVALQQVDENTGLKVWEEVAIMNAGADGEISVENTSGEITKKSGDANAGLGFAKIQIAEDGRKTIAKGTDALGTGVVQSRVTSDDQAIVKVDYAQLEPGIYQPTAIVSDGNNTVEIPDFNAEPIVLMAPTLDPASAVTTQEKDESGKPISAVTTIIPVPGKKNANECVSAKDVFYKDVLKEGDTIKVYNPTSRRYDAWSYNAKDQDWTMVPVYGQEDSGSIKVEDVPLEPGSAFWFTRNNVKGNEKVVVTAQQPSAIEPSKIDRGDWNLVANPTLEVLDLNDSNNVKGVAEGDQIIVPTKGLGQKTYTRKDGNWGYYKTSVTQRKIGGKDVNVLVNEWQKEAKVGAGEGFWYVPGAGVADADTVINWNK